MKNNNNISNKPAYPTLNEFRGRNFINIATALGIGVTAATVSLDLEAKDKKAVESKKTEAAKPENVKKNIILLVANLGNNDFKKREQATSSLLVMGKKFIKDKKKDMTAFMRKELEKAKKSKDPEVKKRATAVLLALTPKPPTRPNHPILMGKVRVPRVNR